MKKDANSAKAFPSKALILILSVFALVFALFKAATVFFVYQDSALSFRTPSFFSFLVMLLELAPFAIFLLLLQDRFAKMQKARIFSIVFALLGASPLFSLIYNYLTIYRDFGFDFEMGYDWLRDLILSLAYLLGLIASLKGFSKKIFFFIPFGFGLLDTVLSLLEAINKSAYYAQSKMPLYNFASAFQILSAFAFFAALLFFFQKAPLLPKKDETKKALRRLNEEFERGTISEEEYQSKRSQILGKS